MKVYTKRKLNDIELPFILSSLPEIQKQRTYFDNLISKERTDIGKNTIYI